MTLEERLKQGLHACDIPSYMHGGMLRYILQGVPPGNFLAAVLCNDLMEACGRADNENQRALFNYAKFLYNYAPSGCFHSGTNYADWLKRGGIEGMEREDDRRSEATTQAT